MSDTLTILRHQVSPMSKVWNADGTISSYGDAKYFTMTEAGVDSLGELSGLLTELETEPKTIVIRGKFVGTELARERDGSDFKQGKVRRALDYFNDQALHALMIDVDDFEPLGADALLDPRGAIDEFIAGSLPEPFGLAGYHWQLSNSAGHPSKGSSLRAHLWFWLEQPLTSAQLKAWAESIQLRGDLSLFNTVQTHYTAAPVFVGCADPYPTRSGFVPGALGDELVIEIDVEALPVALSGGGRGQKLREHIEADPVAAALTAQGLVKSRNRDGGLNIVCPFNDEHSGDSGESATQYFPPNTGGYAIGNFKCLHGHCASRTRGMFLARLGVAEDVEKFDNLLGDAFNAAQPSERKGVPDAKHLTTDQANAGRIINKFGKRLIVVADQWYAWTGKRWEQDAGEVYRFGCGLSKIIGAEATGWQAKKAKDKEEAELNLGIAKSLKAWSVRSEMKSTIEAAIGLLKKMLDVSNDLIDRNPWLLNCSNGTIDLRTGTLKPHDPEDYITKMSPYSYDPGALSPVWKTIMGRVTLEDGHSSQPLADFLQRWFGYCATGSTREHKFLVHYGNGSNGKSTLLDTVADVLGDYSATAAPGLMVSTAKDRHPTEIADLFGRRMVTSHESGEGGQLREDFIKQATGGDKIKARFMRADFFEFAPTHKLQLLTNYKPVIKGQDNGIWRRVLLMPYEARFATAADVTAGRAHYVKDTKTAEQIKAELPGVLAWIVEGARAWYQDGLQEPARVLAASEQYQSEQDRVLNFVNECCTVDADKSVPLDGDFGVYEEFRKWCQGGGVHAMSKKRLVDELKRVIPSFGVVQHRGQHGDGNRRRSYLCEGFSISEE